MEMLFRKVEYAIEGDAPKQKRLNDGPWTREKVFKKTLKISLFFLLSFIIANFFLAYIIGIDELKSIITDSVSQHLGGLAAITIFSFVFFGVYTWFREQAWRLESQQFRMKHSYYTDKNNYLRNSPFYHVENMKTPLLLWAGKSDYNINWYQSIYMYMAMKKLNKEGKLILFNNDGHYLTRKENQEMLYDSILNWFNTYLK